MSNRLAIIWQHMCVCVCARTHVHVCECAQLLSCVQPFVTSWQCWWWFSHLWLLRPRGLYPSRLLSPWDFPGKNTGVGCHFLFQEIFLTQGSNLGLLHWQVDSLPTELLGRSMTIRDGKSVTQGLVLPRLCRYH